MTRAYRANDYTIQYVGWKDEGALLARTSQRFQGVQKSLLELGRIRFRSMYGLKETPFTDHLLLSLYEMHLDDKQKQAQTMGL